MAQLIPVLVRKAGVSFAGADINVRHRASGSRGHQFLDAEATGRSPGMPAK
jgi:hypothetical protein